MPAAGVMTGQPLGMPSGIGMFPGAAMPGLPAGAFAGNPNLAGGPAGFPNAAQLSQDPASPFSMRDDGTPNAFTELIDPRPRIPQPYTMVFRAEALSWWISKGPISADLVTTSTDSKVTVQTGVLGQPGTQILVPASAGAIDYRALYGFRASMGLAIGYVPPIEVSGFSFNRNFAVFDAGPPTLRTPFLGQPLQNFNTMIAPNIGQEAVAGIRNPGVYTGTITIESRLSLWGVDVNTFFNCIDTGHFNVSLLLGYRHVDLYESLESHILDGGAMFFGGAKVPAGFIEDVLDVFRTRNSFDGGQIGLRGVVTVDRFSVFSDIKLAMGNTYHTLTIDGKSTLVEPVMNRPQQTLRGGILAPLSNNGITSKNEFSVVPEANVSLSYQIGPHIRLFGGCSILYWSSVARPGDYINNIIDARGTPFSSLYNPKIAGLTPRLPPITLRDFWAEGVFVGIEIGF
jgi:hypothetical protein